MHSITQYACRVNTLLNTVSPSDKFNHHAEAPTVVEQVLSYVNIAHGHIEAIFYDKQAKAVVRCYHLQQTRQCPVIALLVTPLEAPFLDPLQPPERLGLMF